MTSELVVWAQADVLTVRTRLVPVGQASALETLVLRAIQAGANRADAICDVFGLAPRLVEDMLGDLWRAGRISIDLGTEQEGITLTSSARLYLKSLADGADPQSAAVRLGSEQVAHDRLTGRALPLHVTRSFPGDRSLVVPTMADDPQAAGIREAELADAVTRTLTRRSAADTPTGAADPGADGSVGALEGMRIDAVYLAVAPLHQSTQRRYVPLRVQAIEDATGALTVRVIDDTLPLRVQEVAARRLQGLIADRSTARFVTRLRSVAQRAPLHNRDLSQMIAELRRAVDALPTCPPSNRQRAHDQAAHLTQTILAYVRAVAFTEMDAEVITTAAQHREMLAKILGRARRQVVIAAPWLRQAGVHGIRDALIAAVERGVQVTVLWGINSEAEPLDPNVLAMFDEIEQHARRADRGGALRYHRERGARSHAKVAVGDDRELLITSKNFLSGSSHIEAGVLLRVPATNDDGTSPLASPVIEKVLEFLYNHTPDPATAFQMIRTRGGFGPRREEPHVPAIPMPRLTAAVIDAAGAPEHAAAWAAEWQETARALDVLMANRRPAVEVITDGQHAALVREALEDARQRVLITSDHVATQALTAEVCSLAQARAARGLDIGLLYGEVKDEASDERLAKLPAVATGLPPDVRHRPGMHAKVVVRDETTVLGSFNHLSVNAGVRGLRATGELSVRISSAAVAERVWQALLGRPVRGQQRGAASDALTVTVDGTPPGPAEVISPQLLLGLLAPPAGPPKIDALVAVVLANGPARVLATVRHLQLGADAERQVLAAAALPMLAAGGTERDERLATVLGAVWETGAWACAEVLRRDIRDPDLAPRTPLVSAMADSEGRAAAVLGASVGEPEFTAAEGEALAVSTSTGLLLGELGAPELVDLLHGWERPPAPTDELVAAALDYWARYGPLPAAVPDAAIRRGSVDLGGLREAVETAVESLRRYDTHSHSGDAVRDYLFSPKGEMSGLMTALSAADYPSLRAWAEMYADANDSRWLTKVTKAANQPPIKDGRQVSFVAKHRAIRGALRALNDAAASEEKRREEEVRLPADQAAQVRRLDKLAALAAPSPAPRHAPEQVVVTLAISRLRARIAGRASANRPVPAAVLQSWALPQTRLAVLSASPGTAPAAGLLAAVCRDLAAGWSGPQAVRYLLDEGEFGLAADSIAQLHSESRIDAEGADELRQELSAARARAADMLDARARAMRLRCERVGLDSSEARWQGPGEMGDRLAEALARSRESDAQLEIEIQVRREALERQLAACRSQLRSEWAAHVESLLEAEELSAAALALTPDHRDSKNLLPQPVQLSAWSWRGYNLAQVAAWFDPGASVRPRGIQQFVPEPLDTEAAGVVAALRELAAGSPQAPASWLAAVQALVAETDTPPDVQMLDEGGATAGFVLPYDVRLPRLRWVGLARQKITIGAAERRAALHFSLELSDHRAGTAIVSVADVLSLLGRDPDGRPASQTTRALRFLSIVCSQLPLAQVIAAEDTPAELALDRRMTLAWLLHILGFTVTAADLDRLRVLGGGHQVPLWYLIDAAREDPVNGIGRLWERPDRDEILRAGLAADLDSETDLLVLSTLLAMEACDRASLAEALELVWTDADASQTTLAEVDLDAAVARLIAKGYIVSDADGRLHSCSCPVVRAQHRRPDLADEIQRLVRRMHAALDVRNLMYRDLLAYAALHADQAESELRSAEDRQATARRTTDARMSDRTPFDLRPICAKEAQRADVMRENVDVYWDSPDGKPVWVAGPEAPYTYLVRELLTNAISAVDTLEDGQPRNVWLSLETGGDTATATLMVRDNGPGLPDDFLEAFEQRRPLVRRDRPTRGNGFHRLRMYMEGNGAHYELGESDEGGAMVAVRLPLVADPGLGSM